MTEAVSSLDSKVIGKDRKILVAILIAVILGVLIGGFFPGIALYFSLLGEIFLNLLMMIVVPIVILSLTMGVTALGDIRQVGSMGWRTCVYFISTTAIAAIIGLVLVNLLNPGTGIPVGEKHPDFQYEITGESHHTVTIKGTWDKTNYDNKYVIILEDQKVQGVIREITENSVTVKLWEYLDPGDIFYVTAEDGTDIPFERISGELVSVEPELSSEGTGIKIALPLNQKLRGEEEKVGDNLSAILIGDKKSGKEGLIPRNVFNAMKRMDMLPLILFSILVGIALTTFSGKAEPLVRFMAILNDAMMMITHWVMALAPVGIFGIIASRIGLAGGFKGFIPELFAMGAFSFTVLLGLAFHSFVVLPLILWYFGKKNPLKFAIGMGSALLNAFSTASSSATLPMTMEGLREQNGISNRTSSFVVPLGTTINMNGTALYEAIAAIFIAQMYGDTVGLGLQLVIILTASLAAVAAAGVPEAGLITMVIVLKAVGLPVEGIGLILTIDFFLDRFRTAVNVWGDAVGAGVIEQLEGIHSHYKVTARASWVSGSGGGPGVMPGMIAPGGFMAGGGPPPPGGNISENSIDDEE